MSHGREAPCRCSNGVRRYRLANPNEDTVTHDECRHENERHGLQSLFAWLGSMAPGIDLRTSIDVTNRWDLLLRFRKDGCEWCAGILTFVPTVYVGSLRGLAKLRNAVRVLLQLQSAEPYPDRCQIQFARHVQCVGQASPPSDTAPLASIVR